MTCKKLNIEINI